MNKNFLHLTHTAIDLKAIRHNLRILKQLARKNSCSSKSRRNLRDEGLSSGDLLAVIKADAYGHGMMEIAKLVEKEKGVRIAVSDVAEGKILRDAGIKGPILLLETSLPAQAPLIIQYNLTPTVCSWPLAQSLNTSARTLKKLYPIHVKVDTGMRRQGVNLDEAYSLISEIFCLKHLRLQGIYTHFPSADNDPDFTQRQMRAFQILIEALDRAGLNIPFVHASNSMGLAGYTTGLFNLFRPGLALYGLYPSLSLKTRIQLKPAMSVVSKIILIKSIAKGDGVSYGHTFTAKTSLQAAVIPIGYNDGYFRAFSNQAYVLVGGRQCPVLGRVTMDQIVVDVSSVKHPDVGMDVVILGRQGKEEITADGLARLAGTINYEIVCSLGGRLPKIFKR